MTPDVALDTDALIKCSCFDLLQPTVESSAATLVLGVAKFVVRRHLTQSDVVVGRAAARERFERFLASAVEVEPTQDEIRWAIKIEEAAADRDLQLDTGESLLCSILIHRGIPRLVTGDKRAVRSIEQLLPTNEELQSISGRVAILEQLAIALMERVGVDAIRRQICAERRVDVAFSICFSCANGGLQAEPATGLQSYIVSLRAEAPSVLCPDDRVFGD